jgi:hypothetical protein
VFMSLSLCQLQCILVSVPGAGIYLWIMHLHSWDILSAIVLVSIFSVSINLASESIFSPCLWFLEEISRGWCSCLHRWWVFTVLRIIIWSSFIYRGGGGLLYSCIILVSYTSAQRFVCHCVSVDCVPGHFSIRQNTNSHVHPGDCFSKLSDVQLFLLWSPVISQLLCYWIGEVWGGVGRKQHSGAPWFGFFLRNPVSLGRVS